MLDVPLLTKLRAAVVRFAARNVLAAVSGGPDSVALLRGLCELRDEVPFTLYAAHVHHGWRGAEADGDAEFVQNLGNRLGVPTEILHVTPEHQPQLAGKSREEGARDVRYELLIQSAARRNCGAIAVGHTADDQVETVLHHILRGTGLSGLAGMPAERPLTSNRVISNRVAGAGAALGEAPEFSARSPELPSQSLSPAPAAHTAAALRLIRPLLDVTRVEVLQFLAERQQPYRVDATNADAVLTRNRLRLRLLPLLREEFNPRVDAALLRLAEQAGETTEVLESLAQQVLEQSLLAESESQCRLDAAFLAGQPEALVRQTLRRLWIRRDWPRQEMGRREWDRLAALIREPGAIDLPGGIHARRDAGPLVLSRADR